MSGPEGVVRPIAARWPDRNGRFELRLPARVRGRTLSLWQDVGQFYSRAAARPGGPVDLTSYPKKLLGRFPQDVERVTLR